MQNCKLYSGVFWIFVPNVIKIDPYNFELYRFKFGAFLETQCIGGAMRCVLVACRRQHIKRLHQVNATIRYPAACSTSSNTSPDEAQRGGKWEMKNCPRRDANATIATLYTARNKRRSGNIPTQKFKINQLINFFKLINFKLLNRWTAVSAHYIVPV